MRHTASDIRYAVRTLLRAPAVTGIALLTLALGIGANTALFSVARTVVLDPLPFPNAERLVLLATTRPAEGDDALPFSLPDFLDVQSRSRAFAGMAAWALSRATLAAKEPEQVQMAITSASFFDVLDVRPALGRAFRPNEDAPASPPVVVIAHSLWQRRFGGDPAVVGGSLVLDGRSYEIVGVMPAGFRFLSFRRDTEVWMPLGPDPFVQRRYARGVRSMAAIARLAPGTTLGQARAEAATRAAALEREYPGLNRGRGISVLPLTDQVAGNLRSAVLVLSGAVVFVLLIACANVASLLLARGAARQRELAIRHALGGSRRTLVRQLLTEHVILALAGGALGVLVAAWGVDLVRFLPAPAPSLFVPYTIGAERIVIDRTALLFTAALSLLTGLGFGLVPALAAARTNVIDLIRQTSSQTTSGRRDGRLRRALVVVQVALAAVLLVGAGLVLRTFVRVKAIDPGFEPGGVVTIDLNLAPARYAAPAAALGFVERLLEQLRAEPGVAAAGAVEFLPLSGFDGSTPLLVEGQPPPVPGQELQAHYRSVTPDYFRAIGMRLVEGRGIVEEDGPSSARVMVVNETLARRAFDGTDPRGRRAALTLEALRYRPDGPPTLDAAMGMREIVGVIADVRHATLRAQPVPEVFVPFRQRPVRDLTIVVRGEEPLHLAGHLRRIVHEIDPGQPIASIATGTELLSSATAQPRFNLLLLSGFASLALILAVVGVYGIVAWSVAARSREMGIRLALGGRARDVAAMVVLSGVRLMAAGLAAGLAASLALARLLSGLLYEITPLDPLAFGGASALLALVALAATLGPALRASRIDPVVALRSE
jgi:putative ABC transport system permease protein